MPLESTENWIVIAEFSGSVYAEMAENILIDKTSADLLKGSEVDYVSELIGESFKISNPQTKSSCGCGVSFSL